MLCHGGLFVCTHCAGLEGSLPTHCPGTYMSCDVADEVYAGRIDFDRQMGWVPVIQSGRTPA